MFFLLCSSIVSVCVSGIISRYITFDELPIRHASTLPNLVKGSCNGLGHFALGFPNRPCFGEYNCLELAHADAVIHPGLVFSNCLQLETIVIFPIWRGLTPTHFGICSFSNLHYRDNDTIARPCETVLDWLVRSAVYCQSLFSLYALIYWIVLVKTARCIARQPIDEPHFCKNGFTIFTIVVRELPYTHVYVCLCRVGLSPSRCYIIGAWWVFLSERWRGRWPQDVVSIFLNSSVEIILKREPRLSLYFHVDPNY